MALNTWWTSDPAQRYWMEITHREDLGANLQSPKLDAGVWSYDLVSQVQPGDRVLHWKSGATRALVGWSEVTGPATTVPQYTWQPRGTVGRSQSGPRTSEGWVAPLGGLKTFATPPTLDSLLPLLDGLMDLNAALTVKYGEPVYFPFYRYGGTQIRTQQAYFVKFPIELFDLIPGIESARQGADVEIPDADVPEDYQPAGKKAPAGRTTRVQDPVLRAAIENHAVAAAVDYYKNDLGATEWTVLGKPYDIRVTVAGVERHCEVKGSSMLIDTVELTINEVNHGRDFANADLIVVDGIKITLDNDTGAVMTTGGRRRVWTDWSPTEEALSARRFAYTLPRSES